MRRFRRVIETDKVEEVNQSSLATVQKTRTSRNLTKSAIVRRSQFLGQDWNSHYKAPTTSTVEMFHTEVRKERKIIM